MLSTDFIIQTHTHTHTHTHSGESSPAGFFLACGCFDTFLRNENSICGDDSQKRIRNAANNIYFCFPVKRKPSGCKQSEQITDIKWNIININPSFVQGEVC